MTKIAEIEFAAVDFESAGSGPGRTDHPVQIGMGIMRDLVIKPEDFFTSYIACPEPVTWSARKVHGIVNEDLVGAPVLAGLWPQIEHALGNRAVVAHGAGTEKRFLRAFPLHGFGPWIDTLSLARAVYPNLASHALGDIIADLGLLPKITELYPAFRWHDALSDALASLVLLQNIVHVLSWENEPLQRLLFLEQTAYYAERKSGRSAGK